MQRYSMVDLIKRWEREELTMEQTVGQILLWVASLSERVTKLESTARKPRLPGNS